MFLGCNYSRELVELIKENEVDVDFIKLALYDEYREGFEISRKLKPVLLHGVNPGMPERVGTRFTDTIDWQRINRDIRKYRTPHLGIHLDVRREDLDDLEVTKEQVVYRLINGAEIWKDNICVPLLVENIPYSKYYASRGALEYVANPEVIREVCEKADVGFLLDTSHARVTAWYRNEDINTYLSRLPLERVMEIHVAGPIMTEDTGFRDRHLEMSKEDYEILEWILQRTNSKVISLEYGGPGPKFEGRRDRNLLKSQLMCLRKICEKYS